jgi:hypothetical protein
MGDLLLVGQADWYSPFVSLEFMDLEFVAGLRITNNHLDPFNEEPTK